MAEKPIFEQFYIYQPIREALNRVELLKNYEVFNFFNESQLMRP